MGYEILYNFISPVTGRILCDHDKILVGDINGIAIPSIFIPIGALPDLPMGNVWIGNNMNRPTPNPTITIDNLPELMNGNLWIGNNMNRPIASTTITIDNLPNLSSGKVWIGNGMIPSRPVEGSPPQGPAGPQGPPGEANNPNSLIDSIVGNGVGSLVKFGLEEIGKGIFKTIVGVSVAVDAISQFASTVIDGVALGKQFAGKDYPTPYIDYRTFNPGNNSLIGLRGAEGMSGIPTLIFSSNININGARLEGLSPSPQDDYDAVPAKWVWDLLNDNVEIVWAN